MNLTITAWTRDRAASARRFFRRNLSGKIVGMWRRAQDRVGRCPCKIARLLPPLLLLGLCRAAPAVAQPTNNAEAQIAAVQAEMNAAIQQVQRIVNQPVAR